MRTVVVLTNASYDGREILPALDLLPFRVRAHPAEASALLDMPDGDVVLVDGRGGDLSACRSLCRVIQHVGSAAPVVLVVTEGGLAAVSADWAVDDVVLSTAGPAEVDARLRLVRGRRALSASAPPSATLAGTALTIDEASYAARIADRDLRLTFKEFELLKFLSQHPGRVFTRQQLVDEVWGTDYFGGTRTVDVHVRRLRAKLGPDQEHLIGTVRNVGYRFVLPRVRREPQRDDRPAATAQASWR